MQSNPGIRQFTPDEWPLYKTVRLNALQSDPKVFGSSYALEEPRPDAEWRATLERGDMAVFGVFDHGRVIGMTGIVIDKDDATVAKLWGSWLEPAWRSRGVSEHMYRARIDWARGHATAKKIIVSHRASNTASQKANQKHGFVRTHAAPHEWRDGVNEDQIFYELVLKP
jgi:RimJ/RimL family protein N-acetyltransferase